MNNIFILMLSVCVILALLIVLYQKNKVREFYNILAELSQNNKIEKHTQIYIEKEIVNIGYVLRKDNAKLKALPLLKEAYLDELKFLSEIISNKNLSDKQKDRLITIIQSKLISNIFVKI